VTEGVLTLPVVESVAPIADEGRARLRRWSLFGDGTGVKERSSPVESI